MSIADEIERLRALHADGALTADEFAQAKAALLSRLSDESLASDQNDLREEIEYLQYQNRLIQLDQEWEQERQSYMVRGRYGSRYIPSEGGSLVVAVAIVGFGLFWTFTASSMPGAGIFPLFGVLFILFGVGTSLYSFNKARAYKQAEQNYLQRRRSLLSRRAADRMQYPD